MEQLSAANHEQVKYAHGHYSKPYLNTLSPGCWKCAGGTWACVFITHLCTRNCFFCLRTNMEEEDFVPYVERDIKFESVDRFIEYLQRFPFDGISFSGGEPFAKFDRLYEYIKAIRQAFGKQHYLWVYSNGDPVNEDRLKRLSEEDVNEVRFDIAARDYDLGPVSLALKHIPTVSIEIPAIPEDVETVKSLLPVLESMGVKYVNLHQLMEIDYNSAAFAARGYTVIREAPYDESTRFPVRESESAALDILNYAAESNLRLGINYCSIMYKYLFQRQGFRRRYAPLSRSENEEITPTGYLRSLTNSDCNDSAEGPIDLLDPAGQSVKVTYNLPWLWKDADEDIRKSCVTHLAEYGACSGKSVSAEHELTNQTAKLFFQLLFVEAHDIDSTFEQISALYGLGPDDRDAVYADLLEFYRLFEKIEYLPQ